MHRWFTSFLFLAAIGCSGACDPASAAGAPQSQAPAAPLSAVQAATSGLAGNYDCTTTQADGLVVSEHDSIRQIGSGLWVHGTARPDAGATEPYYDYYLGYTGSHWTYIQIDPSGGIYFVGNSEGSALSPSRWHIVFPSIESPYSITSTSNSFTISREDLTQFCQRKDQAAAETSSVAQSAPPLTCKTWEAGIGEIDAPEYLTISTPQNLKPWYQGIAKDGSGNVIYEYNIFSIKDHRYSVLVNASTGAYAIATSYALPNLNSSAWTVVYPTEQVGFAFKDATYKGNIPTGFTLIFKDGYQKCG